MFCNIQIMRQAMFDHLFSQLFPDVLLLAVEPEGQAELPDLVLRTREGPGRSSQPRPGWDTLRQYGGDLRGAGGRGGRDPIMGVPCALGALKGSGSVATVEVHQPNRYVICPQHENQRLLNADSMESLTLTGPAPPRCSSPRPAPPQCCPLKGRPRRTERRRRERRGSDWKTPRLSYCSCPVILHRRATHSARRSYLCLCFSDKHVSFSFQFVLYVHNRNFCLTLCHDQKQCTNFPGKSHIVSLQHKSSHK